MPPVAKPANGGAQGGFKWVRKSADESVSSSTSLQNDDELLFAIGANESWMFNIYIIQIGHATPDCKYAITVPTGASLSWGLASRANLNTASSVVMDTAVPVTGSGGSKSLGGHTDRRIVTLSGTVQNGGNAGNVTLQWAQNTSDANAHTVKAGSFLEAVRE